MTTSTDMDTKPAEQTQAAGMTARLNLGFTLNFHDAAGNIIKSVPCVGKVQVQQEQNHDDRRS